eukprot:1303539-Lingulodinium_polyedra.AAC.1
MAWEKHAPAQTRAALMQQMFMRGWRHASVRHATTHAAATPAAELGATRPSLRGPGRPDRAHMSN